MFSDNPEVSSKRIVGVSGIIFIMALLSISFFTGNDFSTNHVAILQTLGIVFGGLLGVSVFKK